MLLVKDMCYPRIAVIVSADKNDKNEYTRSQRLKG